MKRSGKISRHALFLGVDGGGTKTRVVLSDFEGKFLAESLSGPSNPLRVGVDDAVRNISDALFNACEKVNRSHYDIVSAVFGLAGVRRHDMRDSVGNRFGHILPDAQIKVVTDAEIALFGTTLGKPGIVVVSGTGSICFGKNRNGETATAGGWGPIAGDEGGGVGIARRGLQAIAKALDGRDRQTTLSERGAKYFRASGAEDLIVAIYSPTTDNKKIAGFAKHVVEAALEGDMVSIEIIIEAGFELGLAGCAVIRNLRMESEEVVVGTVGSVFKAGELLLGPMLQTINGIAPKAFIKEPELEPAVAAARMALEELVRS